MKWTKKVMPINIYMLLALVGCIFWIVSPEWSQFMGCSSMFGMFLLFLSFENRLCAILALIWIPLFIIGLVVSYILVYVQRKIIPFLMISGADLFFSCILIIYKICTDNYTDLFVILLGLLVRTLYYIWMILNVRKNTHT